MVAALGTGVAQADEEFVRLQDNLVFDSETGASLPQLGIFRVSPKRILNK